MIDALLNSVSKICLGTAQYGSQLSERDSFALLDRYVELGGNAFDTAHVYGAWDRSGANGGCGNSELVLGRWLKAVGLRSDFFVGTKGGHPDFDTKENGMNEDTIRLHLSESLDRLGLESVDVYWLHRDDRSIPVSEILGWLEEPYRQGLIRSFGCSHWREDRLEEAHRVSREGKGPPLVGSQIAWSLAQSKETCENGPYGEQLTMNSERRRFHDHSQLPVFAYNAQAAGFFARKYDGVDFASETFPNRALADRFGGCANLERRSRACDLAAKRVSSANQVALAWLLAQSFPCIAIIGPRTMDQVEDSMKAGAICLDSVEREWLESV